MRRNTNYKVLMVSITLSLLFIIVGANVFIVSIFGYHVNSKTSLKEKINGIHQVENELLAKRGTITDRNGTVLAQDVPSFTLYASLDTSRLNPDKSPAHVFDKETTATQISSIINLSYEETLAILNSDAKQVEFGNAGKYLSLDQKNKLIEMEIPGLGFYEIISRNYPLAPFAPNILGFSRFDEAGNIQKGQLGVELLYNDELTGVNGYESYQKDGDGYILKQIESHIDEPEDGSNIKLTLDRGIQETLENAMEGMSDDEKVKAKEVWGAVVEIKTGRILGWGEYPAFDPNDPNTNWNSRGVQYSFEPGSTMKTFTIASAIDQGVYDGLSTFDSGPFHVGLKDGKVVRLSSSQNAVHTITNANNTNYGQMTYDYGYAMSSNVMIAEMMSGPLDIEKFHENLLQLGFFKPVNMDRIGDVSGVDLWDHPLDKLTNGFGQGSTVTMLQMVQAYSAIFGNGTTVKPYIIDEILNPNTNEVIHKGQTIYGNKVYKETTAKQVQTNMREVVSLGSGMRFDIDEVTMIGKTGTAQYVAPGVPGYSDTEYIFSSILAFPYDDPEVMVYTAYRANLGHSINAQANYVKDVLRKVISTYDFQEDNPGYIEQATLNTVNNFVNIGIDEAYESLRGKGYQPVVIGDGARVISQYPLGGSKLLSNEFVLLYTGDNGIIMPDMNGWSLKQVRNFMAISNLQFTLNGTGFVQHQSLASGSIITPESEVVIDLD